jgi:hypothetical protein
MASKKFPSWILNLIVSVLGPLISLLTPQIKEALTEFVQNLYDKAQATDNPVDDVFVRFLAALLDVDLVE